MHEVLVSHSVAAVRNREPALCVRRNLQMEVKVASLAMALFPDICLALSLALISLHTYS